MKNQIRQHLNELENALKNHKLWEQTPPSGEDLANTEPFCVSTLSPTQWLQWIFIPRMNALLEASGELPRNFSITLYLEEALKDQDYLNALHAPLLKLETLLKDV